MIKWKYVEPLKRGSLAHFEKEYHCSIPEDLSNFLSNANGAIPDKKSFDSPKKGMCLAGILSFNKAGDETVYMYAESLCEHHWFGKKTLKMIPFASDPFGNLICLKGNAVVFWNHETDAIKKIAGSLEAFLEMLY